LLSFSYSDFTLGFVQVLSLLSGSNHYEGVIFRAR
jgi:hypothetical protein